MVIAENVSSDCVAAENNDLVCCHALCCVVYSQSSEAFFHQWHAALGELCLNLALSFVQKYILKDFLNTV